MPPVSVVPEKFVSVSAKLTMNLLEVLPTVSVPLLVKLPPVVKTFPPVTSKVAPELLVAKFIKPFPPVEFSMAAAVPVKVMFAALVTMLAPANCSRPVRS